MLLEQINSPQDVKSLSKNKLPQLAEEIREFLIRNLAVTGGHLAPNLGVVELTIMLHYLFDSPKDKLIWDVGHQAYVHKLLTGRMNQFATLRQFKGLCGFPKRCESEHDVWETGHSSTSLSAAMGMAKARELRGNDNHVIAVIGDGALTGGMALEALNHIGHEETRVIVVLNDNEMSISNNVGAIHKYLSKIRTDDKYIRAKDDIEHLLKKIPAIGDGLYKTAGKLKDSVKQFFVSGMLFEELGFTYLGPINGHDFEDLEHSLLQAKKINGPVLLHVITKKGKGYHAAEKDANTFHGIGPYKVESGEEIKKTSPPSYQSIFAECLTKLAGLDTRIVAITPAMISGSGLKVFEESFPDRLIDVGIAEQHAVTLAGGLAIEGLKPVVAIYSTFLQRAYDQVIHDICRQNLNVFFAIDRAGLVGADGETHQGVFDIAFMRVVPNIVIMMPKDENEMQHMIYTGTQYDKGPIAIRYPRGVGLDVTLDPELKQIPIGSWEVLREGNSIVVLSMGPLLQVALMAAEELANIGIQLRVINARFIKPLDEQILAQCVQEDIPMIILEEGSILGGFGSSILEYFESTKANGMQVKIMGIPDQFIEHGSVKELLDDIGLNVDELVDTVKQMISTKQHMQIEKQVRT